MKIYDYLICKKDYKGFIKGRSYVIRDITFTTDGTIEIDHSYFVLEKNHWILPFVYDYFYTEQEIRKLKLDKINENNM